MKTTTKTKASNKSTAKKDPSVSKSSTHKKNIDSRDLNADDQRQPTNAQHDGDSDNSSNQESYANDDHHKTDHKSENDIEQRKDNERIGEEDDEVELN